jgi:hypothetical protein
VDRALSGFVTGSESASHSGRPILSAVRGGCTLDARLGPAAPDQADRALKMSPARCVQLAVMTAKGQKSNSEIVSFPKI